METRAIAEISPLTNDRCRITKQKSTERVHYVPMKDYCTKHTAFGAAFTTESMSLDKAPENVAALFVSPSSASSERVARRRLRRRTSVTEGEHK